MGKFEKLRNDIRKIRGLVEQEEQRPIFKDQTFEGRIVSGKDRIAIRVQDPMEVRDFSGDYIVTIKNPNRGTTYYPMSDLDEFDRLADSLKDAIEKAKDAVRKHKKEVDDYYERRYKARHGL